MENKNNKGRMGVRHLTDAVNRLCIHAISFQKALEEAECYADVEDAEEWLDLIYICYCNLVEYFDREIKENERDIQKMNAMLNKKSKK